MRHVAVQSLAGKTDGLIAFSRCDLVSKTHRGPSFARMGPGAIRGDDKGLVRSREAFVLFCPLENIVHELIRAFRRLRARALLSAEKRDSSSHTRVVSPL